MPVYNLTVDGGEYFANGILVHNCDCLAWAVLALDRYKMGQRSEGPTIFRKGRR